MKRGDWIYYLNDSQAIGYGRVLKLEDEQVQVRRKIDVEGLPKRRLDVWLDAEQIIPTETVPANVVEAYNRAPKPKEETA